MTKGQIKRINDGDLIRRTLVLEKGDAAETFEGELSAIYRECQDRGLSV
jgi:hypothetical protein